ncbi:hypothetical protein WN944_020157 [Citrus x changshan-huyou]|uniref:ABC transporter domain-containing protein n=1 Tax=Citrus x changshan-huyou TaxID=2935761 RepID=A0AAP0LWM8_9ROSI
MILVESILQFTNIPSEAPEWSSSGKIELENLLVQYNPTLPMVLKGITCTFPGEKKIGVVGRTGSGKSTLIQALFRVVEPSGGRILIGGVDISKIGKVVEYDSARRLLEDSCSSFSNKREVKRNDRVKWISLALPCTVILYVNVAIYALFGHMNIHNPRSVLIAVHLCMIAEGIINHVDVDKLDTPQLSPHS